MNTSEYLSIIENIKSEIKAAQYRAAVHANVDMLLLYHDIGCVINEHKSWGNKFIDNLATDIRIAFPESKGYSVRNLNTWQNLPRHIQIGNLCRWCLHKFRGLIILQFWKKSKTRNSVYGTLKKRLKTDGHTMF